MRAKRTKKGEKGAGESATKTPVRRDRRKATLIYMKAEIVDAAKERAAADNLRLWEFVEQAVQRALKSKRRS